MYIAEMNPNPWDLNDIVGLIFEGFALVERYDLEPITFIRIENWEIKNWTIQ